MPAVLPAPNFACLAAVRPSEPVPTAVTPSKAEVRADDACKNEFRYDFGPARTAPVLPEGARYSPLAIRGPIELGASKASPPRKVGILLTSHGDIDDPKTELRDYVREAVLKNPGIPLPDWIRPALDTLGWPLERAELFKQYNIIGPTNYHRNSTKQTEAVRKAMHRQGLKGKAYVGYNFTHPNIEETIRRMHKDGVTDVVVFNQGAQCSVATMGESVQEVEEAIEKFPDWNVRVRAVNSFNDEPEYIDLLTDRMLGDVRTSFGNQKPEDVLILVSSHGLPDHLVKKGDRAAAEMLKTFDKVKARLSTKGYQVEHGFLNDEFFPGAEWTGPDLETRVRQILNQIENGERHPPKYVLIDGRLSFTVHHRATLYDANVVARNLLENPPISLAGLFDGANVRLAPNFDGDPRLAHLISKLAKKALQNPT